MKLHAELKFLCFVEQPLSEDACEAKISALCLYLDTPDSRQRHSSQGQWIRVGVAVLEVLGFSELMKHLQFIVIDLTKLYLCVS